MARSNNTHLIKVHVRFEGTPLDVCERQALANHLASSISKWISDRQVKGEFCDLGLAQETNITIGE